jgi:carbon storage regulator
MLVITRKNDEAILIEAEGKAIEILVLETGKDRVRLGVKAPKEVKIIRNELVVVKTSNVEASKAINKNAIDALLKQAPIGNLKKSKQNDEKGKSR